MLPRLNGLCRPLGSCRRQLKEEPGGKLSVDVSDGRQTFLKVTHLSHYAFRSPAAAKPGGREFIDDVACDGRCRNTTDLRSAEVAELRNDAACLRQRESV
jgi:hypothetical protein